MTRYLLTILIFLPGQIFCQGDWVSKIKTEVNSYQSKVHLVKEKKFSKGDVFGTTSIFFNGDSSVTRVFVRYVTEELGDGDIDYFIVNGILIYKREFVTLVEKSSDGKKAFKLRETKVFFKNKETGLKTSREINKASQMTTAEERRLLNTLKWNSNVLTEADFIILAKEPESWKSD